MRSSAWVLAATTFASALGLVAVAGVGCSSSEQSDAGPDAATACATTVPAMAGKACSGAGLRCTVDYACGAFQEQAVCTCEGGVFVCGDGQGQVEPGTDPRCAAVDAGPTQRCPSQYTGTAGKACTSAWQYCTWSSAGCAIDPGPRLNSCTCRPNATGALTYDCEPDPCSTDGGDVPIVDAGDAAADAADGG